MKKSIQVLLFAIMVTAALSAGTFSVRQLRSGAASTPACGGTCSATQPCATPCVCSFTTPFTAFCTTKLAGAVPSGK